MTAALPGKLAMTTFRSSCRPDTSSSDRAYSSGMCRAMSFDWNFALTCPMDDYCPGGKSKRTGITVWVGFCPWRMEDLSQEPTEIVAPPLAIGSHCICWTATEDLSLRAAYRYRRASVSPASHCFLPIAVFG